MGSVVASKKQQASAVAAVTAKLTGTIGGLIDQAFALRERKRELEAQIAAVEGEIEGIQEQLMEQLDAQGVKGSTGEKASCSISVSVVANVTDWDSFYEYIRKNKFFHLLQRRVSDPSYRELLEAGKKVPGVEPFTKKRLNLRAL